MELTWRRVSWRGERWQRDLLSEGLYESEEGIGESENLFVREGRGRRNQGLMDAEVRERRLVREKVVKG
ncbi:hypothetical protein CCACVL1_24862 [Corchorus capsularis]|uniref:Uncharacterized protein n=1 Tax=Corchorus capsularis TaxID=210143 RepID=A0A1R3GMV0_COCAP|nr:hypothetical protein CCACVL1_24862 [Corchorus capsularis]